MNASRPLTSERFHALLEAYGSRLSRWPAAERAGAEAWLAQSMDAARSLREHSDLDAWLDSADFSGAKA